jgi:multidrug efflux pump subunit AcrA (membrane-fusion protein)
MQKTTSVIIRILICLAIIAAGVVTAEMLASMRQKPDQAEIAERALRVDVQSVHFEDIDVVISGFGTARPRDVVAIAPEVQGRIVEVHPLLEVGQIVPAGEILFRIDPRNYQAQLLNAEAAVAQLTNSVKRLNTQFRIDKERLKTFERSRDLANDEYRRVLKLYQADVGSKTLVDNSEMALNNARDAYDQLSQSLDLFPIRIQEAKNNLASANANATLAAANLERTQVSVDFAARVKTVNLERGQYVSLGANVLSLADDSVMEIPVSLDSKEAHRWLRISKNTDGSAWFSGLDHVSVNIIWTEDPATSKWKGLLHRVEKFDEQTRQLTVVARISGQEASARSMPLVDGMFCQVDIPGKTARHVVRVPAASVGFAQDENGYRKIYLAVPGDSPEEYRLKTAQVLIAYIDGESMYVSDGLSDDDLIVTTRLIDPLENVLLATNLINHAGTD